MSDKNYLQNTISDELREIDNPFKLIMSLGKISRLLESEFEKLGEVFQSIEGKKGDYYGIFYDFIGKELLVKNNKDINKTLLNFHKSGLLNEVSYEQYKGFFKQGFFSTIKLEDYKKLSKLDKYNKIKNYYGNNYLNYTKDIAGKRIDDEILKFQQLTIFKILSKLFLKLFNKDFFTKKISIKSKIDKTNLEFNNIAISEVNGNLDFTGDSKSIENLKSKFEEIERKLPICNEFSKFINLKNIIISLSDNFAYPIFAPFFLGKLSTKLNIDSDTLKIIDVLISNGLSENYEEYLGTKKFFTQLIDRKEKSLKSIYQYLSIVILILLSLIFLPIALNGLFLLLVILLKIKDWFWVKKLFFRCNFGFGIMSILLLTVTLITLINTYKFDNLIILSERFHNSYIHENINKLFLQNPINFIFGKENDEIKKCYNFDYLKEGKSCFEKEDNKK